MKKTIIYGLSVFAFVCLMSLDVPKGWFKAGSVPDKYEMGIAIGAGEHGKNVATIKSTANKIHGFGTLMQSCMPGKYLGKKVRMTGRMKSENVTGWAGFWFRVDEANSKKSLSFDNMYDRCITKTTDWKEYEIILDVPANASKLAYGALLSGKGQIWFDNIKFEIVDEQTSTTGRSTLDAPQNLNFDEK